MEESSFHCNRLLVRMMTLVYPFRHMSFYTTYLRKALLCCHTLYYYYNKSMVFSFKIVSHLVIFHFTINVYKIMTVSIPNSSGWSLGYSCCP